MKKSKYGEETVAVRVPKSRKQDVLTFLKQFEVIDSITSDLKEMKMSNDVIAYKKGYAEGFKKGEKMQYLLGISLAGSKEDVQLALDVWEKRIPDSMAADALTKIGEVILNSDVDVGENIFSIAKLIEKQ